MRKVALVVLGATMMMTSAAVSAKEKEPKPVELSEVQLDALQKREIQGGVDIVFRSSISALQEMG